ncbi:MAG: hypothetical protein HY614_00065 [Candidatus Rokubacteria bacterium]|nr:hypothetical protein [Candidatus Rokubacteria bacterium]
MAMIAHPHVKLDERGGAGIDDANVKVIETTRRRWTPRSPARSRRLVNDLELIAGAADLADFAGRVEYLPLR